MIINPVADTARQRDREEDDEHEEPEAAEAMRGLFFLPVCFVAGAGLGPGDIELLAALASGQWDSAVAGREVVVGLVRMLLALEGVIWRGEAGY